MMVVFAFKLQALPNFASGEGPSWREEGGGEWRKDQQQRDQSIWSFCIYTRTLFCPFSSARRTEILFSNLFTQKSACSIINSPACRPSHFLSHTPLSPPPPTLLAASLDPPFSLPPSPLKPALSSHSQASSQHTRTHIRGLGHR